MFYSHRLVNTMVFLVNLINFYLKLSTVNKTISFGKAMSQIPSKEKENIIKSICFVSGFKDKTLLS